VTEHRRPLLIVAYALAPGPGGAEALVNAGLVDALTAAGDEIAVVAAPAPGHDQGDGADRCTIARVGTAQAPRRALARVTGWLAAPRHLPTGALARFVDRSRSLAGVAPLRTAAWSAAAGAQITELLERDGWDGAVVWARATPPESFEAAIVAHRARPFPLVANYNDPMPPDQGGRTPRPSTTDRALRNLQRRQNRYLARHAEAWTFPSTALRDLMVEQAALDPRRCFVIPHLVPARPAAPRRPPTGPPRLLYAGSLYRWAFEGPLPEVLRALAAERRLSLVVAATRATDEDIRALCDVVPDVEVHRDLDGIELDALVDGVDALLVVDNRPPLLPTKVVDGVRRLRPLVAVAPPSSTTSAVIGDAGGLTADRSDGEAIEAALRELIAILADPASMADRRRAQALAAERFSAERVVADARTVVAYAARRFDARSAGESEPVPPTIAPGP